LGAAVLLLPFLRFVLRAPSCHSWPGLARGLS
jgi:hypothetical protein